MSHPLKRICSVEPRSGFDVVLRFDDGVAREVNLEPYLYGPMFEEIRRDPKVFRLMRVEAGTIVWPNGADIDPLVLYYPDLQPDRLVLRG